jgi:hypothetical protein
MRLTLRTLLAYLDHTLDPADEAALSEKVQSSTIASSLVRRIQTVLKAENVGAPSPDATSPNDDANTVAEYLDSTLAPELTADVERRCLESESHLAEVAASHQVLAATLTQPANVPSSLRRRIYDLQLEIEQDVQPDTSDSVAMLPGGMVMPVGPEDSGVSDATTRLRNEPDLPSTLAAAAKAIRKKHRAELKQANAASGNSGADTSSGKPMATATNSQAIAGIRSRQSLEELEPLLSGGRSSRVVPFLVSLALTAAFLFVLTKAFSPLLAIKNRDVAREDAPNPVDQNAENYGTQGNKPAANAPDTLIPATPARPEPTREKTDAVSNDKLAAPDQTNDSADILETPTAPIEPAGADAFTQESTASDETAEVEHARVEPAATGTNDGVTEESAPQRQTGPPVVGAPQDPASLLDSVASKASDAAFEASMVIGGVQEHGGLLLTQEVVANPAAPAGQATGDSPEAGSQEATIVRWKRVAPDEKILNGQVLVCPPSYRSRLVFDGGVELTMVGPAGIRIERKAEFGGRLGLTIDFGRVTLMTTGEPNEIWVGNPVSTGWVDLRDSGAMVAIEVNHRRLPSQSVEHSSWKSDLFVDSLAGTVGLAIAGSADQARNPASLLPVGQRFSQTFGREPSVDRTGAAPDWIDSPDEVTDQAAAAARKSLAELVQTSEPVEAALLKAIDFRDVNVAGLAARTLVNMGVVYFCFGQKDQYGPPGLLNRPEFRSQWPAIVESLRDFFDRGEDYANSVAYAALAREGENDALKIITLLKGFTQGELDEGGAAILVAMLDDPKMSVRVFASETLRMITGDTLDYRPDFELPAQRRSAINKWKSNVRNESIRWAE